MGIYESIFELLGLDFDLSELISGLSKSIIGHLDGDFSLGFDGWRLEAELGNLGVVIRPQGLWESSFEL